MRAKRFGFGASAWLLVLTLFCAAGSAHAQTKPADGDEISGDIKGTVGLGLVGLEVGLLLPPLFKLQNETWAWFAFPAIGAAGGVVGGIFAFEQADDPDPKITVPVLAGGMALLIPAVVGALALKSRADAADIDADFQTSGAVQIGKNGTRFSLPAVSVSQVFTPAEQLRYGAQQRAQYSVSLFSGRF